MYTHTYQLVDPPVSSSIAAIARQCHRKPPPPRKKRGGGGKTHNHIYIYYISLLVFFISQYVSKYMCVGLLYIVRLGELLLYMGGDLVAGYNYTYTIQRANIIQSVGIVCCV